MSYEIPGLEEVKPVEKKEQLPGSLTDAEVSERVRYWDKPQCDPTSEDIAIVLVDIQNQLQVMVTQKRNDKLIGIEDFNIAVITDGKTDQQYSEFVPDGKGGLFVSKETDLDYYGDLLPPPGGNYASYVYTTANKLVATATAS